MSTTDNIHKKVLATAPLKTNFITNTTQKTKNTEKRFSQISKEKETGHEYGQGQTIHKNAPRYHDEIDLQGSATILPQKNSSRKNIYMNQNNHIIMQGPSHQRKQSSQQLTINNTKAKSPMDKIRINNTNQIGSNINMINNNGHMMGNNMTGNFTIEQNIQNQLKPIPQLKNLPIKTNQILSDRERSLKSYRQKQENPKDQQINKMKSLMFMNNRKFSTQIQDLMCDQQIEISLVPQKQLTRKLSNLNIKNQINFVNNNEEYSSTISDHLNENNRTQKKLLPDKPIIMLQKTKSEHTISIKQHSTLGSATLVCNTNGQKQISHLMMNNDTQLAYRQQQRVHIPINFIEDELRRFTTIESQINMGTQVQTILGLQIRQRRYTVQPNYIEIRQKNLTWFMRAILMDWMMHVCFQFQLKRQTFHIAVSLVDKFLENTTDLQKAEFQLVGAASMFIAVKLEEFQPLTSAEFAKSTDNRYSPIQIKQMQLRICKTMNYELNPPTLYMWANRFMVQWDNYIDNTNARFHPYFQTHKPKYFKRQDQQSYCLFRQMMQFIDCSILDVQTLQFAHKILVFSFMYLVLGKSYKEWSLKRIAEEFPRTSHYLLEEEEINSFNHLFHMFLSDSFELDIIELLPAVQYCSTYITLPLNFEIPQCALRIVEQGQASSNLEQYESFQTYNGKMIELIKKRFRGVYQ